MKYAIKFFYDNVQLCAIQIPTDKLNCFEINQCVQKKHTHKKLLHISRNLTLILIGECQTLMQAIKNTGSVMMIASRRLLVYYMVVITFIITCTVGCICTYNTTRQVLYINKLCMIYLFCSQLSEEQQHFDIFVSQHVAFSTYRLNRTSIQTLGSASAIF